MKQQPFLEMKLKNRPQHITSKKNITILNPEWRLKLKRREINLISKRFIFEVS